MYGIIHQSARRMGLELLGEARWDAMLQDVGLSDAQFVSAKNYSDDVTSRLTTALQRALGMEHDSFWERMGAAWIEFTDRQAYGSMFGMAGGDFGALLDNLDRMHSSIRVTFSEATMPEFEFLGESNGVYRIIYRSIRTGYDAYMRGILLAIARRFGLEAMVEQEAAAYGVKFTLRTWAAKPPSPHASACR